MTKYHLQAWVVKNAPKLASYGRDLASPALSLGKGALSLVFSLFTIFVLVVLMLLEGPKLRAGLLGLMAPDRAEPLHAGGRARSTGQSSATCSATSPPRSSPASSCSPR